MLSGVQWPKEKMSGATLFRFAGWSAILSAIGTILGFVAIIGFIMVGGLFGVTSDVSSIIISLTMFPILWALYQLHRSHAPAVSLGALVMGLIAMLIATILQVLLVIRVLSNSQTEIAVLSSYGVTGMALITFNYFAYVHDTLSRKLAIWGIVAGAGYFWTAVGYILGRQNHLLTYVGGLLSVIAYPVWAIWLGRVFLKSN
jgi:hypothetical protein